MKQFSSPAQKIGEIGENIAETFLVKQGFSINERNYGKRLGEIDIIAKISRETLVKGELIKPGIHFFEVKTIKNLSQLKTLEKGNIVSRETYNPAHNVTRKKLRNLVKMVEYWFHDKHVSPETLGGVHLASVILDYKNRTGRVEIVWNINTG